MANLQRLREELDAGHPVTGAYSVDDSAASEDVNAKNRVRINSISSAELLVYKSQFTLQKDVNDKISKELAERKDDRRSLWQAVLKIDPTAEELRNIK
jgi:hypothetical protein